MRCKKKVLGVGGSVKEKLQDISFDQKGYISLTSQRFVKV